MNTNELPLYDQSDNPTGCCPRFKPGGWDNQDLHFKYKLFVRAETRSMFHVPINMSSVFERTFKAIGEAGAQDPERFIVMSRDLSPWRAEHLFSVTKPVDGQEMVKLSGDFHTKVFEGPYRQAGKWHKQLIESLERESETEPKTYFFYTTCPKCAKAYGENYLVGMGETPGNTQAVAA